jgi:hypothetical protein
MLWSPGVSPVHLGIDRFRIRGYARVNARSMAGIVPTGSVPGREIMNIAAHVRPRRAQLGISAGPVRHAGDRCAESFEATARTGARNPAHRGVNILVAFILLLVFGLRRCRRQRTGWPKTPLGQRARFDGLGARSIPAGCGPFSPAERRLPTRPGRPMTWSQLVSLWSFAADHAGSDRAARAVAFGAARVVRVDWLISVPTRLPWSIAAGPSAAGGARPPDGEAGPGCPTGSALGIASAGRSYRPSRISPSGPLASSALISGPSWGRV